MILFLLFLIENDTTRKHLFQSPRFQKYLGNSQVTTANI